MSQRVFFVILLMLSSLCTSTSLSAHYESLFTLSPILTLTSTKDTSIEKPLTDPSLQLFSLLHNKDSFLYFRAYNLEDTLVRIQSQPIEAWEQYSIDLLNPLLNSGYPFANIAIQHFIPNADTLDIYYSIDQGIQQTIDTIYISGTLSLENDFLYKYIDVKPGTLFHFKKMEEVYKKIDRLPFAEWTGPPELKFTIGQNEWLLPINKRKSNTIDGLIGIQSDEASNNGIKITADIQLHLWNVLNLAEELLLNYKSLESNSPHLEIAANIPYLAGLDFGPEINFNLDIKDSSYQKNQLIIGARYYLSYLNYIRISYYQENSDIITPNLSDLHNFHKIPEINNYKNKGILLGANINTTDYYWLPRRGWKIEGNLIFYQRKMIPHQSYIEEGDKIGVPIREWYNEINEQKYNWSSTLLIHQYMSINNLFNLASKINIAHQQSNHLSKNELHRIGGSQGLRGFDELRFYASSYGLFTFEPRFFLNSGTYLFLFSDLGWLQSYNNDQQQDIYAWGLGAGLNLMSKNGLFNIAFGVGKEFPHSFNFKSTQVHINYKAIF